MKIRSIALALVLLLVTGCYQGVRLDGPQSLAMQEQVWEMLNVDAYPVFGDNPLSGAPEREVKDLDEQLLKEATWRVLPIQDECSLYVAVIHKQFPYPMILRLEDGCGQAQTRAFLVLPKSGMNVRRIGVGPFQFLLHERTLFTVDVTEGKENGESEEKVSDRSDIQAGLSWLRGLWPNLSREELKQIAETAQKWGVSREGLNQGITHYFRWQDAIRSGGPDRLSAIAGKLGLNPSQYSANAAGFAKFTDDVLSTVQKFDLAASVSRPGGVVVDYSYLASKTSGDGVHIIQRGGLLDSVMPKDLNNFRNFITKNGGIWR